MKSPFFDDVAVLKVDVLALRDQVLARLVGLVHRLDRDATLVLVVAPEPDGARDFGDDRRILRTPRLEQLGHPRQTAGDVTRLRAFGRDTGEDVARLYLGSDVDRENGIDRQHVAGIAATGELEHLAILALHHDGRTQVRAAARRAPVDDHALGDTGGFVERFRDRLSLDQILEANGAFDFGEQRPGVGIPLDDALAALDHVALVDVQARTVLDTVRRTLGAVGIDDCDNHVAHHRDQVTFAVAGDGLVPDHDLAVEVGFDERLLVELRRTTDVEGAHGELGPRLAD